VKVLFNQLEELLSGVEILGECTPKTLDHIMSFGELLSATIITAAFNSSNHPASMVDSRDLIICNNSFGNAQVDRTLSYSAITDYFTNLDTLPIITGFIGRAPCGATTTLGRGGSDLSAAIFGAALNVDEIEIWTDVDGMLTADPRKVSKAFTIPEVSFEEAMELSHFGAKVIYPPTMQPAVDAHIPIIIKNTFNPEVPGTRIIEGSVSNPHPITGISSIPSLALLRLQGSGMVGVSGTAARFFKALALAKVNVILITQASSEHTICCAIDPNHVEQAKVSITEEFALELTTGTIDPLVVEGELSILSVVGENMRHSPGISGRIFSSLGANGVNIVAIAQGSSERNISAVVSSKDEVKALNAIHDEFFIHRTKTVNLWLAGTGLIGKTLLKQIADQSANLRNGFGLDLQIRGLSNSRKMMFSSTSISPQEVNLLLSDLDRSGSKLATLPASNSEFITDCLESNLPHSIFVDCTASDQLPAFYPRLLESSVAVVTPNKRGFSSAYEFYSMLRASANSRRTPLLHETCVGAALPILGTLSDLIRCGDTVIKIEAVLSGTLSYIFNSMRSGASFSHAVIDARSRGYTEPDPREDLSGLDVARKVLILARDAGLQLEFSDIKLRSPLPEEVFTWSLEEFIARLSEFDSDFKRRIDEAENRAEGLFFSANIACSEKSATIDVASVPQSHPFFSLSGADNIVAFTTSRYNSNPLVIKGPGAGAEVTAAGVFADIIRAARY
jgi:aspartokinase/homoserine dehydrogenase 1